MASTTVLLESSHPSPSAMTTLQESFKASSIDGLKICCIGAGK